MRKYKVTLSYPASALPLRGSTVHLFAEGEEAAFQGALALYTQLFNRPWFVCLETVKEI